MDRDRWVRNVYEMTGCNSKWIKNCSNNVKKFGYDRKFTFGPNRVAREWKIMDTDEDSLQWSMNRWKGNINKKVAEVGLEEWTKSMKEKPSLNMYGNKIKPQKEEFYDGSFNSALLFKARTNSLETGKRTYRWTGEGDRLCKYCNLREEEDVSHFFIECSKYELERDVYVRKVMDLVGELEWGKIRDKDDNGVAYLLGLEGNVKRELVEETKNFLGNAWEKRRKENPNDTV